MKNNNQDLFKKFKRGVRVRTLFFLAISLSVNSFAWFLFNTKVDNSIEASVKSWRVKFEDQNNNLSEYITFDVSTLYPGMPQYSNSIKITNEGETPGEVVYELEEYNVMGDSFSTANMTPSELEVLFNRDYPFNVRFTFDDDIIAAKTGVTYFRVVVDWPFESNDDERDTFWGTKAYDFKKNYPSLPCVKLRVKISVKQIQEQ